ncbi:Retrovirus-related Pol polyprotein from transposon TNT 1-94 [Abeliophyllum distichum]|uniref:Retrovirus-related Pol polyprotein from transposon TNT 1-94 n=1 Tax=Abeliophyllum distichum TaxID=126358 RepID=A0ABD1W034_9LAMI
MRCNAQDPDIAFAISKLSRFTSNPSEEHWKAIGRVLGYLKKTKDLGLQYSKFSAILEGLTDASWISNTGENKSTSGWGIHSWRRCSFLEIQETNVRYTLNYGI